MRTPLIVLSNEVVKELRLFWSYKLTLLFEAITLAFTFVGMCLFVGHGEFSRAYLIEALPAYLIWYYASRILYDTGWRLALEAQAGTLEQMMMAPVSSVLILLARMIARMIASSLLIIILGIILYVAIGAFPLFRPADLLVLLLTLIGVAGLGLVIGGCTLLVKQTPTFAAFISNVLLFFNGAILPIHLFPDWLEALARLLPTTLGIEILRKAIAAHTPIHALFASGELTNLGLQSLVYLIAGWILYVLAERIAKRLGTLGQY